MSASSPFISRSAEPGMVDVFAEYPIGATGAVGTATRKRGVTSLTRTGTGAYTLTLDGQAYAILGVDIQIEITGQASTDGLIVIPKARTTGAAPTVTFETWQLSTAAAADPKSGSKLLINIRVKKSIA